MSPKTGSSFERFTDDCFAWYSRDRNGRYLMNGRTPVADVIEALQDLTDRDLAKQALSNENLEKVGQILRRAGLV
jgi:hypothetical protein